MIGNTTYYRQIAIVLLIAIGGGLLRGCAIRPATDYPGRHFNRGLNAIWIGVEWVNQPQSEARIMALADALHQHQIWDVFVYVTYLKANGQFNPSYGYSIPFITAMHRLAPDLKLLAWIGLPLETVDVSQSVVRDQIAALCRSLTVADDFDGIHLDPEPIENGNSALLTLLGQIKNGMPKGKVLLLATRVIAPIFPGHFQTPFRTSGVAATIGKLLSMSIRSR